MILREYLIEMERNAKKKEVSEDFKEWLLWAKQKADWYDPFVNFEDPYLTQTDKQQAF